MQHGTRGYKVHGALLCLARGCWPLLTLWDWLTVCWALGNARQHAGYFPVLLLSDRAKKRNSGDAFNVFFLFFQGYVRNSNIADSNWSKSDWGTDNHGQISAGLHQYFLSVLFFFYTLSSPAIFTHCFIVFLGQQPCRRVRGAETSSCNFHSFWLHFGCNLFQMVQVLHFLFSPAPCLLYPGAIYLSAESVL